MVNGSGEIIHNRIPHTVHCIFYVINGLVQIHEPHSGNAGNDCIIEIIIINVILYLVLVVVIVQIARICLIENFLTK